MSWLYNRHFKIGAGLFVAGFVIGNIPSYVAASRRAAEITAMKIQFAPAGTSFPPWGFPFRWDGDLGTFYNLTVLLLGALFFGLLFRWITGIIK